MIKLARMTINSETIAHLAHLARLELSEAEKKKYQKDMLAILDFVASLQAVPTSELTTVETEQAHGEFRPDAALALPVEETKKIINLFPEKEGNLNKVKAVFE